MSNLIRTAVNTFRNATPENFKKNRESAAKPETDESNARLAICTKPCPYLFTPTMQCSLCGCPVKDKVKTDNPAHFCPKGYWK